MEDIKSSIRETEIFRTMEQLGYFWDPVLRALSSGPEKSTTYSGDRLYVFYDDDATPITNVPGLSFAYT